MTKILSPNAEALLGSLVSTQVPAPNDGTTCPVLTAVRHPEVMTLRLRSLVEATVEHPLVTMIYLLLTIGLVVGAVVANRRWGGALERVRMWAKSHESLALPAAYMLLLVVGLVSANKLMVMLALFLHAAEGITHNPLALTVALSTSLLLRKSARKAVRWARRNKVAASFALTILVTVGVHLG